MPPLPQREAPRIPHLAPERRRQAVDGIREKYGLSERHACRIVGQHRGTQRYVPTLLADEDELTRAIIALASEYGRYGYRRVTALLQAAGWQVGKDRFSASGVARVQDPQKHRPRSRLWLNDGSCVRLRPLRRNHVWSFDFVQAQTHDGRSLRILTLIDEHSGHDVPARHPGANPLRQCPEMISKALRKWVAKAGSQIQYIAPGSPWENGYCENFNGKLKDECLRQEIFYSLKKAQIVNGLWQDNYNRVRRIRPWTIGRPRLSATLIWPSGYPWPLPCSSLPLGSVQNTVRSDTLEGHRRHWRTIICTAGLSASSLFRHTRRTAF